MLVPDYAKVSPLFEGYGDPEGSGDGFVVGVWVGGGFMEPPPPPPQEAIVKTIVAVIESKNAERMFEMVTVT